MSRLPHGHPSVRLEMILGEICVWVAAEGRRRGCRFESCAAPILYCQAHGAKEFMVEASQEQRYEFYRNAFEPLAKFVRKRDVVGPA